MVADQPDFTSSVNVSGGSIVVEPGATVQIDGVVTANVLPKVAFIGNYDASTDLIDVTGYNALIILMTVENTTFSAADYGYFGVTPFDSTSGMVLPTKYYFVQASTFNNNAGSEGNTSQTVFPLHGMDTIDLELGQSDSSVTTSVQIFATTESLPEYHRTQDYDAVSHILSANMSHVMASGGATFPIPVSSNPIIIISHLHSGNTTTSQTQRLTDSVTGVQLGSWVTPKGQQAGEGASQNEGQQWVQLPHSMNPMQWATGSATSGDLVDFQVIDAFAVGR